MKHTDYPDEALLRNEQGIVKMRLDIDPAGKVSRCTVTLSSKSRSLDQTSCTVMQRRGRFTPARDAEGNPVADTYDTRLTWFLVTIDQTKRDKVRERYAECVTQQAKRLSTNFGTDAEIVTQAFINCKAREDEVVADIQAGRALKIPPAVAADLARDSVRGKLTDEVAQLRKRRR